MIDKYEQAIHNADNFLKRIFVKKDPKFRKTDVEYIGGGAHGKCSNNAEDYIREYRIKLMGSEETRKHYHSLTDRYMVQAGWLRENYKIGSYIQHYWIYDSFENRHFDITELNFDDGVYFTDNKLYKRMRYLDINCERFGYKIYLNNIEIRENKIFLRDEYNNYKEVLLSEINEKLLLQTERQHDLFFR